jgi:CheY-like chemotaxis protein
MVRSLLERAGYQVEEAVDGQAALDLYRQRPFDLVIVDLVMRGKGGIEVIVELKKTDPKARVIAISGAGRGDPGAYLDLAESVGASCCFAKPLPLAKFLKAVRDTLS